MKHTASKNESRVPDDDQLIEPVAFDFGLKRRAFVQALSTGLLVAAQASSVLAQRAGGRGGASRPRKVSERIHLGMDGVITVLTGKVEVGQGVRAELTQAAAEELRVHPNQIRLTMSDTGLVPDDGITAGSRSTPSSVPAVRQAAAAARELLAQFACERWGVERATVE